MVINWFWSFDFEKYFKIIFPQKILISLRNSFLLKNLKFFWNFWNFQNNIICAEVTKVLPTTQYLPT